MTVTRSDVVRLQKEVQGKRAQISKGFTNRLGAEQKRARGLRVRRGTQCLQQIRRPWRRGGLWGWVPCG